MSKVIGRSLLALVLVGQVALAQGHSRGPISVSYSSLYYDFQGTRASRDNSYAFRDITLLRHNIGAAYVLSPEWNLNFSTSVSRIYAETYLGFNGNLDKNTLYKDHTEGLNDSTFSAQYIKFFSNNWMVIPEFGVSLPTGSITEKNKNPGAPQYNYAYNMQLGTGTFDVPLAITAMRVGSKLTPYARAQVIARTGRNSQGYQLGDEYIGVAGADYTVKSWLVPGIRGLYRDRDGITGQDKTYGRIPIVEYYHHHQINWDVSAIMKSTFKVSTDPDVKVALEAGIPLVQGLKNYDGVIVDTQYYGMLNLTGQF